MGQSYSTSMAAADKCPFSKKMQEQFDAHPSPPYKKYVPDPKSLYERLGGVWVIADVINTFSDRVLKSPAVGINSKNPQLREWSRKCAGRRLAGLKFQRTLWVCAATGGPQTYVPTRPDFRNGGKEEVPLGLHNAHAPLLISEKEFAMVAGILKTTMEEFGVAEPEKKEVLDAFASFLAQVVTKEMGGATTAAAAHRDGGAAAKEEEEKEEEEKEEEAGTGAQKEEEEERESSTSSTMSSSGEEEEEKE